MRPGDFQVSITRGPVVKRSDGATWDPKRGKVDPSDIGDLVQFILSDPALKSKSEAAAEFDKITTGLHKALDGEGRPGALYVDSVAELIVEVRDLRRRVHQQGINARNFASNAYLDWLANGIRDTSVTINDGRGTRVVIEASPMSSTDDLHRVVESILMALGLRQEPTGR